jgi:MprA protease rhombosortase-interaction domain-containing protein
MNSTRAISGVLLIAAAIIGAVGNALHPHSVDTDAQATLRQIAESGIWVWIHLAIIVAVLLLMAGLAGFARDLEGTPGEATARVANIASLLGGAFVCVSTSIDGFGRKALALNLAAAPSASADAALQSAVGIQLFGGALWTFGILIFFGLAFVAFGAAATMSARYPAWFGGTAVAAGAIAIVAAGFRMVANGDEPTSETLFLVSSVAITVWAFVLGTMLWRNASAAASATATSTALAR